MCIGALAVWLSYLEHCTIAKRLQVRFLVGAHTQVAGSIAGWGACEKLTD